MKTFEYVKEHFGEFETDNFFDHRFTKRFLDFVPVTEFEKYGFRYCGEGEHVIKDWTEENIIAQLKEDCALGIEKATHHRGISASLMYDVCIAWCKVLENGLDKTDYGYYGDKLFRAIDEKYKFGLVNENTFNGMFYAKW